LIQQGQLLSVVSHVVSLHNKHVRMHTNTLLNNKYTYSSHKSVDLKDIFSLPTMHTNDHSMYVFLYYANGLYKFNSHTVAAS
jgi:hypothetical protein